MSENNGIHEGHRDRLREKFIASGGKSLPDHQLLELLLFYGVPRRDTNVTAHRLLDSFGSFSGVFDAPADALQKFGLSRSCTVMLKLIPELCARYYDDKFKSRDGARSQDAVTDLSRQVMRYFIGANEEQLFALLLDTDGKVIYKDTIGKGVLISTETSGKKLIRLCAQHKAKSCVLARDHANDLCLPTDKDIRFITEIKKTLRSIGAVLYEYYIISGDRCIPLSESEEYYYLFQ